MIHLSAWRLQSGLRFNESLESIGRKGPLEEGAEGATLICPAFIAMGGGRGGRGGGALAGKLVGAVEFDLATANAGDDDLLDLVVFVDEIDLCPVGEDSDFGFGLGVSGGKRLGDEGGGKERLESRRLGGSLRKFGSGGNELGWLGGRTFKHNIDG